MALVSNGKKLHGFSKNERLCNFTLKKLVFDQGHTFSSYPFHIYWKLLDMNLESLFFSSSVTDIEPDSKKNIIIRQLQNPSWPHKQIPANALFQFPAKCLIGVSKKSHRKAVTRNHLRRLTKEAYRKHKHELYSFLQQTNQFCLVSIIYTAKTCYEHHEIEKKIIVSLQKLQQEIRNKRNI
jgi:ribonuclease P protein component